MTVEEIEIQVTANVEQALKEFKKMLPEVKKQIEQMKKEIGSFDLGQMTKDMKLNKVKGQVQEVAKEVQKAKKTIKNAFNPDDIKGLNFQNVKQEINGASKEFQKLKGSSFDLGNMIELQKYKKKIKEVKPAIEQVNKEISKIGFVKYDSKSIENFVDNYKKEADGSNISGMKINGMDFDKIKDDLSNINELKKYQENIKKIGTNAEKAKNEVQDLSKVEFVDYSKIQAKDLLQNQNVQVAPSQNNMSFWEVLKAKIAQVRPEIEKVRMKFEEMGRTPQLEVLKYKISTIEEKLQKAKNGKIKISTEDVIKAEAELDRLKAKKDKMENAPEKNNLFLGWSGSIKKIVSSLGNVIGITTKAKANFNGLSGIMVKINNQIKQMGTGMKRGLGHILKYAGALFSLRGIYSMLSSSASAWLNSQNAGAQQLKANIDYLKYSMGSALAPAIQFITNLMYNLLKAIQSVVYALFKVNIFAKASSKSYASMAGSAKKAKNETKTLAGIHDEINNVQKNDNADSGSGGTGSPSFDLSGIDNQMSPLAQKLYDFFKPLKESWDIYGPALVEQIKTTAGQIGYLLSSVWGSFENVITNGTVYTTLELILAIIGNIAEAFANAWNYHGNGDVIIQNLANALNNLLTSINNFVTSDKFQEWLNKCSDKLKKMSDKIAEIDWQPIVNALGSIGMILGTVVLTVLDLFISALEWLSKHPDVATVLLAIGAAITIVGVAISIVSSILGVILPILTTIQTISALLNVGLLATAGIITGVIVAVAATIAIVVAAVVLLAKHWDEIKAKTIEIWNAIIEALRPILEEMAGAFKEAWEVIKLVWDMVQPYFQVIWDAIKAIFSVVVEVIGGFFRTAWEVIKAVWNVAVSFFALVWAGIKAVFAVVKGILSGNFKDAWEAIKNVWNRVKGFFQSVWDGIKSVFSSVANWFSNVFSAAWNAIKSVINVGIAGIEGMINNGIVAPLNLVLKGLNGIVSAAGKVIGIDIAIPTLNSVSIPRLAKGNVAYDETVAIFGEYAGASNNPEITTPQSIMAETFESVLSRNGRNNQPISLNLTVKVSDKKLGTVLIEDLKSIRRQTGKDLEVLVGG